MIHRMVSLRLFKQQQTRIIFLLNFTNFIILQIKMIIFDITVLVLASDFL